MYKPDCLAIAGNWLMRLGCSGNPIDPTSGSDRITTVRTNCWRIVTAYEMNESREKPAFTGACPCGSGTQYIECCGRLHCGLDRARTAEQLMRSRYTAYVLKEESYIFETWDPATRPVRLDLAKDKSEWIGLKILSCKKGAANNHKGIVDFQAYFSIDGKVDAMREISYFVKVDNRWVYRNGESRPISAVAKKTSPDRNARCPCGSGKKYKRCCGAA